MTSWDNDITTDKRPYVMEIQRYLRTLERAQFGTTAVPQDGFFDTATADGVRRFQQSAELEPTGIVDLITWETLVNTYREQQLENSPPMAIQGLRQPLLHPGDTDDAVIFLNVMLGLYDTIYTTATAEAIRNIQKAALLPITGNTDKFTWDAVVRLYNQGERP